MDSFFQQIIPYLGFVLLGLAGIISVAAGLFIGGFKCGELRKTIQFKLNRSALDSWWAQMHNRLQELGFKTADGDGRYLQTGEMLGNPGSFTHAKTNKELTVNFRETGPEIEASVSLRYLTFVVYDSGESAYRDAVLDYVSGQSDRMRVVPNLSLLALNSLTGGAVALLAAALIFLFRLPDYRPAILVAAPTAITVGLVSLVFILLKRGEISGKWPAITGIILSAAALAMAYAR